MLRALIRVVTLSVLLLVPPVARADEAADYQQIIAEQLAAFLADDGGKAYSYAAPSIKAIFPSPEIFMAMVKKGYPQVYRPRSYTFADTGTDPAGRPTQDVTIIDGNGAVWTAVYTLERQPDGSWKIAGCAIVRAPGADA